MGGGRPGQGGATTQSVKREEESERKRGLTDLSGVCTCEGNKTEGQIKGQTREKEEGEIRAVRGRQGADEGLRLSWPNSTPQPRAARRAEPAREQQP